MKEFIAYTGNYYTIEWYIDKKGKSQPLEYYKNLDSKRRQKVLFLFKRMGDFGSISDITKFRSEGNKIYAFKPQPDRFLSFFISGRKIIITNAYEKKSDKMPRNELNMAIKLREEYLKRQVEGDYYE